MEIRIFLKKQQGRVIFKISDNGIGLPGDINLEAAESLGMQLIQALTAQLDGELEVSRENGTEFTVSFAYPKTHS